VGDTRDPAGMVPAVKKPPPSDGPLEPAQGGAGGGFLTGTLEPAPPPLPSPVPPTCIAAVMVDGGTRFALDVDPESFEDGSSADRAPSAFRCLLTDLRLPTTREQEQAWRAEGGRSAMLPLPEPTFWARSIAAAVKVTGGRRESITLEVPDLVYLKLNIELGTARLQLKARGLWAEGYARMASRWLDLVLWWCTGRRCTLAQAHSAGWKTTGIEVCSDFVGFDFSEDDRKAFVGFKASELVHQFSRDDSVETINIGTRASPVSLCLYDKDVQLVKEKGGDDSTYRAHHLAHGWNGIDPRRRVEFRLNGRALHLLDRDTGEVLDLRNPAVLADRDTLTKAWVQLAATKRLIVPDSSTRRTRCALDPRWVAVIEAGGQLEHVTFRQSREAQTDAWNEATKRARRDAQRALHRVAALHDTDAPLGEVLEYIESTGERLDADQGRTYRENYREQREAFLGDEIRRLGGGAWQQHRARAKPPST
jgi:hypothetical protein